MAKFVRIGWLVTEWSSKGYALPTSPPEAGRMCGDSCCSSSCTSVRLVSAETVCPETPMTTCSGLASLHPV